MASEHTYRMIEQVIRLTKGILTALENWLKEERGEQAPPRK